MGLIFPNIPEPCRSLAGSFPEPSRNLPGVFPEPCQPQHGRTYITDTFHADGYTPLPTNDADQGGHFYANNNASQQWNQPAHSWQPQPQPQSATWNINNNIDLFLGSDEDDYDSGTDSDTASA